MDLGVLSAAPGPSATAADRRGSLPPPAPRREAALDVIGLDHLYVSVSDFARAEAFYDRVMRLLGFRKGDKPIAGEPHAHYFNAVIQYTIRPARRDAAHDPYAPGLHHVCFQLRTPADVDAAYAALREAHVDATPPRRYPEYNPDYYATFFRDPDGLRLELVCRTPYREELAARWHELDRFLNPLAALHARDGAAPGGTARRRGSEDA